MEYGEGLAVLGVFLKVRNPKIQTKKWQTDFMVKLEHSLVSFQEGEESSNYQLLFDLVQEANKSRKAAPVPATFDLEQLLPATGLWWKVEFSLFWNGKSFTQTIIACL